MIGDLLVLVAIVVVVGGVGIAIGMLIAPRIGRLVDGDDDAAAGESAESHDR